MRNRKIQKLTFRYGDLVRLGGNALLPHPFYPDFSRHFRHSGSPDRQFFRKTEVPNLQFGVKNARCGAMRAIFDPFSDYFPVGKTGNFSKTYVKKRFSTIILAYWQPESHKTAPDGQIRLNDFQIRKYIFLKMFFNRTEYHTPTHG